MEWDDEIIEDEIMVEDFDASELEDRVSPGDGGGGIGVTA